MKIKLELEDLEKLKSTAEEIIKNAEKDLVIWTAVLKEAKCQIRITSKA